MPKTITSLKNPRVQSALKLRGRRSRARQGRIVVDGARELLRALEAGLDLTEVFVCPPLCQSVECRRARSRLEETDTRLIDVTPDVFAKLAYGKRAEGVVGVAAMPRRELAELALPDRPLVAVMEGPEKPGNVGAVIRSADAAGVSALVVADRRTDLFNPNAIRASLGTIFTLPVCEATGPETLAWLRDRGMNILAARVDGETAYSDIDFSGATALVLGGEVAGLSPLWRAGDITGIRLPMLGVADSLNLSATAAVLFYEALRQRASPR